MKVYTFGEPDNQALLLLPGKYSHYRNTFGHVIPALSKNYYVHAVSYDGMDDTEDEKFTSLKKEIEKIEAYITEQFGGNLYAAYGSAFGGMIVTQLVQRKKVHITHAILGSSDLSQASKQESQWNSVFVGPIVQGILKRGDVKSYQKKILIKLYGEEYTDAFLKTMGVGGEVNEAFVSIDTIHAMGKAQHAMKMRESADVAGTTVHIFYAAKMSEEKKNLYEKYFVYPDVREHEGYQKEEMLYLHPEEWLEEIDDCLKTDIDKVKADDEFAEIKPAVEAEES